MVKEGTCIEARNVSVSFDGVRVLSDACVKLEPGRVHALTGENGAGKSTLAKCLAGVYQPSSGIILLDNAEIGFQGPKEAIGKGIALIHQEPLSFRELSVAENVFAGHLPKKLGLVDWKAASQQTTALMNQLGISLDPSLPVAGLSVAQQQMVELASALSRNAKVWIFDETTAPLTPIETQELFKVIRTLKSQGCAIGFVSHHLDEVFEIADEISILRDGRLIATKPTNDTTQKEVISLMVGRELLEEDFLSHSDSTQVSKPASGISVSELSGMGYKNINFEVKYGEVVGFVGLVGAGRSELAKGLFGLTPVKQGKISVGGQLAKISCPQDAMKAGLALIPEDRQHDGLMVDQSVGANASLASLALKSGIAVVNDQKSEKVALTIFQTLQLKFRSWRQPVRELSGGNQQKVVLAKWLLTQSKHLILDEPTRGVDVGAKHEVHKLIRSQANHGAAVMMITSDLPEALTLADRFYVMRKGEIVAEFSATEATQEKILSAASGHKEVSS